MWVIRLRLSVSLKAIENPIPSALEKWLVTPEGCPCYFSKECNTWNQDVTPCVHLPKSLPKRNKFSIEPNNLQGLSFL